MRPVHELATVQGPDSGLVDLTGGEVKAGEVFVGREAGRLHVIGNRADFALCQLRLQKLRQHWHGSLKGRSALFDQVGDSLGNAMHLQTAQHDVAKAESGTALAGS